MAAANSAVTMSTNAVNLERALWATTLFSSISDVAGGTGGSFTLFCCVFGLIAVELQSVKLCNYLIRFLALTMLFDVIYLGLFAAGVNQIPAGATTFMSFAIIAKIAVIAFGRNFIVEDLNGSLGIAGASKPFTGADGEAYEAANADMPPGPQATAPQLGSGFKVGSDSYNAQASSYNSQPMGSYQSAL